MHILYLAHFAGSPEHGMVHAYYHLAQEWLKLGHDVTIVAASYTHTRAVQPKVKKHVTQQFIDGIRYLWVPTSTYKPENHFGRGINIIQFVGRTWFGQLPVEQADLIICSSHHPFSIFPARRMAKKFDARLVFEVRDLWPLSLIELGDISPFNPFIWLMQKAENYAYRNSDHVVSVLSGSKTYMVEHGMAPDKFSFVPNGVAFPKNRELTALPTEHQHKLVNKERQAFWLGFAGRVNNAVALHHLIDALTHVSNTNVKLFILGDGEKKPSLQELVKQKKLQKRVVFLGEVEKAQVATFLSYMDAVYLGLQRQPLFRFGISPTKLNDYMLAAKPVIYAIDAPDDPVAESGCGISCHAEDANDIARAIDTLSDMTIDELNAMGERGRTWILENRAYAKLAERFLEEVMT